ncbi:three component ABC system middle component [Phyllobacterium sp. CCNWLW109]|uniref:three component ABC system middle component n=1 Tax=Phyllobacterium sp. CCNWLW109 TaxID=3127479 RepID=UPI0030789062
MRSNHEELVLRNPMLGACIFWQFAKTFVEYAEDEPPILPLFFVVSAMIFHRPTVDKTYRMNFDSGILKAVAERPDIIAGLQSRIEDFSISTLQALQLATSTNLMSREVGAKFPAFRAIQFELPKPLRRSESPVTEMIAASKRLGAWFATEPLLTIQRHLMIEF